MSEAVSALKVASFAGFVRVEETGLRGMITVRGDLSSKSMAAAIETVAAKQMPDIGKIVLGHSGSVAWMSPDELLIIVPYETVQAVIEALNIALSDDHVLVVNLSDARAIFRLSGAGTRDVLAKLAPVDLSAEAFKAGDFRRTRLAQVAAAFWCNPDNSFELICFRSVAQYVFDVLSKSSELGSEVEHLSS